MRSIIANPEKHGVPRTSAGSRGPAGGKGREAELQKIQEYRTLVDKVNTKVNSDAVDPAIDFSVESCIDE